MRQHGKTFMQNIVIENALDDGLVVSIHTPEMVWIAKRRDGVTKMIPEEKYRMHEARKWQQAVDENTENELDRAKALLSEALADANNILAKEVSGEVEIVVLSEGDVLADVQDESYLTVDQAKILYDQLEAVERAKLDVDFWLDQR